MTRQSRELQPSRSWRVCALWLIASFGFAAGCAKILGDFSPQPAATGTGGAGGSAGASGAAGSGGSGIVDAATDVGIADVREAAVVDAACTGNSTSCDGRDLLTCINGVQRRDTCQFACSGGSCGGSCIPGSTLCRGSELQRCQNDGTWADEKPCSLCVGGPRTDAGPAQCVGVCVPGTTECFRSGDAATFPDTLSTCGPDGTRQLIVCPYICDAADPRGPQCGGECKPGAVDCDGNLQRSCVDGVWVPAAQPCMNSICVQGQCMGSCTPPATQCSGRTVQSCVSGNWISADAPCQFGCFSGACAPVCEPGSKRCVRDVLETCNAQGTSFDLQVPCPFKQCTGTACGGECVPGTQQCGGANGNDAQLCNTMSVWETINGTCSVGCYMGVCGICNAGDLRCSVTGEAQICDGTGMFGPNTACTFGCLDGGACAPAPGGGG